MLSGKADLTWFLEGKGFLHTVSVYVFSPVFPLLIILRQLISAKLDKRAKVHTALSSRKFWQKQPTR